MLVNRTRVGGLTGSGSVGTGRKAGRGEDCVETGDWGGPGKEGVGTEGPAVLTKERCWGPRERDCKGRGWTWIAGSATWTGGDMSASLRLDWVVGVDGLSTVGRGDGGAVLFCLLWPLVPEVAGKAQCCLQKMQHRQRLRLGLVAFRRHSVQSWTQRVH